MCVFTHTHIYINCVKCIHKFVYNKYTELFYDGKSQEMQ